MKNTKILLTSIALVLIILAASCTENGNVNQNPQIVKQWAIDGTASSSFGSPEGDTRGDWAPFDATGNPDVTECADNANAWAPEDESNGWQWLELYYNKPVFVSRVNIRETFNAGAIVKIELKDNENYFVVWEGIDDRRTKDCPGYFSKEVIVSEENMTYTMTPFKTDTVKITLDTRESGWNEIDAVELVGYNERWHKTNESIFFG